MFDVSSGKSMSHFNHQQLPSINAEPASAMHLFLMNPQPRSASPSAPPSSLQGFNVSGPEGAFRISTVLSPPLLTRVPDNGNIVSQLNRPSVVKCQGLPLSLSPSLPHLEVKDKELRIGDGGLLYYNGGGSSGSHHQTLLQVGADVGLGSSIEIR
ncbi:hypothetical protein GOBAR_AA12753 [Gossypium barbadense]|uniref:Uncharacterized protein n=1 Tax=Gossypium barbadense TaxID=3634 RepID=A0A2P5XX41_GOSBA|nr:hypothetical protein GOBAR_AA12753 [Gossypium barbadense]